MKQWILTLTLTLGSSLAVQAGTFKSDEFNAMMKENQTIEQNLRTRLQKDAGIVLDDQPGTIAKEKIIAPADPEQVVVNSSKPFWRETPLRTETKVQDKEEMKRISQELDEAFRN